jgi:hypothetical protein
MMRNGQVYALPTQVRLTTGSESLLLRSPKASEGQGGALGEAEAIKRGNTVGVRDQVMDLVAGQGLKVSRKADNELMPTPTVFHVSMHDEPLEKFEARQAKSSTGQIGMSLGVALQYEMMPTPKALDGVKGNLKTSQERIDAGHFVDLTNVAIDLIGTPRANAANSSAKQVEADAPKARIEDQVLTTNWGKFEPAIRRWEQILGRKAPAPTKPDGKEGAHRLSSKFTEWMMGLPDGWITGHGLSRNDELKMAGNGVVPQQAELALRILLNGIDLVSVSTDESLLPTVMANSPMRNSRRSMVTHPTKRSGVALNQALELIAGILPVEFDSWDEVPNNYRNLENAFPKLPTPTVSDTFTSNLKSSQQKEGSMHSVTLPQAVERMIAVLPSLLK